VPGVVGRGAQAVWLCGGPEDDSVSASQGGASARMDVRSDVGR